MPLRVPIWVPPCDTRARAGVRVRPVRVPNVPGPRVPVTARPPLVVWEVTRPPVARPPKVRLVPPPPLTVRPGPRVPVNERPPLTERVPLTERPALNERPLRR